MEVRPARPDDAGAIAAIYAPHVVEGVASFETEAPDAAEIARRMATSALYPWFVAEVAGEVGGYAYASAFGERAAYRRTVETTVYVSEAAQGRGLGRRLYGVLLNDLRTRGFAQAIARIALPNPASVALHAALGFQLAGVLRSVGRKHGRWIDVGLWQCGLAADELDFAWPDAASVPAPHS